MARVIVILGSSQAAGASGGSAAIPRSDATAAGFATERLREPFDAYYPAGDDVALRFALAGGARTAQELPAELNMTFDIALVGGAGAEPWGDLLAARLAQARGAAMVLDVVDVEVMPAGLRVTRDAGAGAREVLLVAGPAVLGISEEAPRLKYVSRYRRAVAMAGGPRHAHGDVSMAPVGFGTSLAAEASPWVAVRPRVKTAGIAAKTGGSATDRMREVFGVASQPEASGGSAEQDRIIRADAATCAQHLLRYLGHHGFIRAHGVAPPTKPADATYPSLPRDSSRGSQPAMDAPPAVDAASPSKRRRTPRLLVGANIGFARRPRPLGGRSALSVAPPPRACRGPRPLTGPSPGTHRRPVGMPSGATITPSRDNDPRVVRIFRGPRPTSGAARGAQRRPRAFTVTAPNPTEAASTRHPWA